MIVVAGSGIAGMCAAIEAAWAGCAVTLLEKDRQIGGNSRWASGFDIESPTFNEKSQALDSTNNPIPGLFVAGEDAGRPYSIEHGGLSFGLIFGRIAGRNAAAMDKRRQ